MKPVLIIHGPNLHLLGEREPEHYGRLTLADLNHEIASFAANAHLDVRFFQSNHEGAIIDFVHEYRHKAAGVVINPGALTHYSFALRDAISAMRLPTVEVHLSDIHQREDFRRISVIKDVCLAQVSGLGLQSYLRGIEMILGSLVRTDLRDFLDKKPSIDEAYRHCGEILKRHFPKYDWVGIYLVEGQDLAVHNYLGAPTPHTRIPIGSGICGAAVAEEQTIVVPDVSADPRYLACSIETKSEIVVPIKGREIYGEIDIDSHTPDAFGDHDREMLESLAEQLSSYRDLTFEMNTRI